MDNSGNMNCVALIRKVAEYDRNASGQCIHFSFLLPQGGAGILENEKATLLCSHTAV